MLVIGYWFLKKSRVISLSLFVISFTTLFVFSLPFVAQLLNQILQTDQALTAKQVKLLADEDRDDLAIVVLAGGRIQLAPEYGDIDTVSSSTLQRIQYASWLHRKTKLPILVSGGSLRSESTPEAVLMNQTMLSAFNIAPKWIEYKSKNTVENAQYSAEILFKHNISDILLVTHANHMQRAKMTFEKHGFKVTVAPTVFDLSRTSWLDFIPSASALHKSQVALHEKIGRIWFSVRY
ncbi:MAG: YdcF family protein [Kangiellaceae bacterium]|nr:YdcF family protein [Kangiellaceae bacterium]